MSFLHQFRQPRYLRWFVPALLVLYGAVLLFCCVEQEWRQEWDSALYLITARALANNQGYTYLGEPFFLRPPAFPWLLSQVSGGEPFDFVQLNTLTMIAAILFVGAVYFFMRRGFSHGWALLIALLTGSSPLFFSRLNWILSEFFFLALLFPAVGLLERGSRDGRRSIPALVGGSLLLAVAIYFRTVGILVLPAVLLVVFFRRTGSKRLLAVLPVLLVFLLVLPWFVYSHHAESMAPRPAEQFLLFSYTTALFHLDPGDPDSELLTGAHWVGRVKRNSEKLVKGLAWAVLGSESLLAGILLVAAVMTGFITTVVRRGPSVFDLFFLAYGLLLLLYFAYQARLLLPLLPVVYAYLFRGGQQLVWSASRRPRLGPAVAVSAGLIVLLLAGLNVRALTSPPVLNRSTTGPASHRSVLLPTDHVILAEWLQTNTAKDARVVARMAPLVSVLADREVYTYLYTRKRDLLQRLEIDYVVSFGETPDFIDRQVREGMEQRWILPATTPDQEITIYRLKPWNTL